MSVSQINIEAHEQGWDETKWKIALGNYALQLEKRVRELEADGNWIKCKIVLYPLGKVERVILDASGMVPFEIVGCCKLVDGELRIKKEVGK